ncbi:MAG: circadian clock protein KaiC [Verrucomicrobiales bacterium]|nr:circadian clock protein KaiC [Verrucomicrobiales bacterium]
MWVDCLQPIANMKTKPIKAQKLRPLEKISSGISGLDEITGGGLPKGRPTLVCGNAGCGKTLMAMEFLVRGATDHNEPGVFMSFEENEEELTRNVASLGFDLDALSAKKKIVLDHVRIERSEIEETGEYDLEGLFIRLNYAIESIGAKRVVLDTIEGLFAGLPNHSILRSELRRLFRWLKDKGMSAIITAERGDGLLTRHGLEEYVADCVILLDHRVNEQLSTRRLRVVKYRGSVHGTNEYPFLISKDGFSVLPVTSMGLDHPASSERISSGVERLDTMLGGKGFFRGSSILVSGTAGTGKSSIAAAFVDAAARRGERALYFAFEESQNQILRNMKSISLDLEPWVKKGLLQFHASRPSLCGLEMHLLNIYDAVKKFKPSVVVMDPVTNLISVGTEIEVRSMLTRLIDFFKTEQVTAVFPSLTSGDTSISSPSEVGIASLMDVWVLLRNIESAGERNRGLYILKARGMEHSNQIREVILSNHGIGLVDVYAGPESVLTGSARIEQAGREKADIDRRKALMERREREIARERGVIAAQVAVLNAGLEAKIDEFNQEITDETLLDQVNAKSRVNLAANRQADVEPKIKATNGHNRVEAVRK